VLFWALCLCMVLGLAWARRRRSLVLVIALAVVPQLLLLLVSLHTSVLVGRYFTIATPALVVLTALGLAGLWQRRRRIALIVAAPTLVLLLLQSLDAMHQLGKPRFDLAVARRSRADPSRLVLLRRPTRAGPLRPAGGRPPFPGNRAHPGGAGGKLPARFGLSTTRREVCRIRWQRALAGSNLPFRWRRWGKFRFPRARRTASRPGPLHSQPDRGSGKLAP